MNILEIENLSKHYKGFSLKNIQLIIPAGYIFGFVGQNGAGKTSTINMINHICKYQQGTIKVNGITYDEDPVKYKESIAYVGDESILFKSYSPDNQKRIRERLTLDDNKWADPMAGTLPSGYQFHADRDYLLPIPPSELELNKKLKQNPKW